jgi:hypothetical protein
MTVCRQCFLSRLFNVLQTGLGDTAGFPGIVNPGETRIHQFENGVPHLQLNRLIIRAVAIGYDMQSQNFVTWVFVDLVLVKAYQQSHQCNARNSGMKPYQM